MTISLKILKAWSELSVGRIRLFKIRLKIVETSPIVIPAIPAICPKWTYVSIMYKFWLTNNITHSCKKSHVVISNKKG